MDKFKGVAKGGWHPKGDPKFSRDAGWKSGYGLRGNPQDKADAKERENHTSAPLSSLRDPDSFGPPPKHRDYYGDQSPSTPSTLSRASTGPTGGLGSRVPPPRSRQLAEEQQQQQAAEEEAPPLPPQPYSRDTTGLRTDNLPKPPVRRNVDSPVAQSPSLPSRGPAPPPRTPATPPRTQAAKPPPPPPRLPPRQTEYPDEYAPAPPPTYNEALQQPAAQPPSLINEGAAQRLGNAGVSVPGFGIGASSTQPPQSPQRNPMFGELQSRFSPASGRTSVQDVNSPGQGTSWQQKKDAFGTAKNFRNDPSSVSLADARNAASTANSFRERHGAQVASAATAANGLNQKYGIAQRFGAGQGHAQTGQSSQPVVAPVSSSSATPASPTGKKPPPPPPPKKSALHGVPVADQAAASSPPPIPHMSKPKPT